MLELLTFEMPVTTRVRSLTVLNTQSRVSKLVGVIGNAIDNEPASHTPHISSSNDRLVDNADG